MHSHNQINLRSHISSMLLQIVNLISLLYLSQDFLGTNTTEGTITLKKFSMFGCVCFYVCVYVPLVIAIVLA